LARCAKDGEPPSFEIKHVPTLASLPKIIARAMGMIEPGDDGDDVDDESEFKIELPLPVLKASACSFGGPDKPVEVTRHAFSDEQQGSAKKKASRRGAGVAAGEGPTDVMSLLGAAAHKIEMEKKEALMELQSHIGCCGGSDATQSQSRKLYETKKRKEVMHLLK
jgi:hypothetical protein